jgi:S-layer protein
LGAGDDKLLNSSANTDFTGASFSGGDGNDTVAISLMTVGNASKFTSFETVGLDATSGSRDVSIVAGATGLSLLKTAASGATATYTGVTTAQGLTVGTNMDTATGTLLLDFGSAVTTGTADAYTITFAGTGTTLATATATAIKASKVTIDGIEAVSLVSGGSGYTNNTIELKDTVAKTLTITGSQAAGVTFGSGYFGGDASTSTSTAGLSSIDASALTGKLTIDTTNVRTANAGLSVKGGTNDDAITIANQASNLLGRVTVDAGTGDDIITTSTSAATLTGGAGKDTFKVSNTVASSTYLTAPVYTTITDYAAGDTIQMGTTSVVALKTVGVARVSTAISLEDAIAKAVVGNSVAGTVVWFAYGSDTFLVNDATGNGALDSADIIVKLTGLVDLTAASATGSGLVGVA